MNKNWFVAKKIEKRKNNPSAEKMISKHHPTMLVKRICAKIKIVIFYWAEKKRKLQNHANDKEEIFNGRLCQMFINNGLKKENCCEFL